MTDTDIPLVTLPELRPATFVSRHKRFIVHALDRNEEDVRCHLANPGRLEGILEPGATIWLSGPYPKPRKLAWSVHLVEVDTESHGTVLVTVDSGLANTAALEAHGRGLLPVLPPESPRKELTVLLGDTGPALLPSHPAVDNLTSPGRHRFDLGWPEREPMLLTEIKTVSHAESGGLGLWPDAPSARGRKHVEALIQHQRAGGEAALLFVTGRHDIEQVAAFEAIDPEFARILDEAAEAGVKLHGMRLRFTTEGAFWAGMCDVKTGLAG